MEHDQEFEHLLRQHARIDRAINLLAPTYNAAYDAAYAAELACEDNPVAVNCRRLRFARAAFAEEEKKLNMWLSMRDNVARRIEAYGPTEEGRLMCP